MSDARPYHTVPGPVWRRDPSLNGCREDSIAVFHIIAEASDRDWKIEVSPKNHAFSVRQCFSDPERFRRWSEERIDRAIAELRARGCLLLATSNDRDYLEIPDRLAYCKGHKKQNENLPLTQIPLPIEESMPLFALPAPRIPLRVEKEEDQSSTYPAPKPPAPAQDHDDEPRSIAELENALRAAGAKLDAEERTWRRRCEDRGWSQDQTSWRRWLIQALARKPRPRATPRSVADTPAPAMPPAWGAFVAVAYPENPIPRLQLWRNAQKFPDILAEFAKWEAAAQLAG